MLNTDLFKFWFIPKGKENIAEYINSAKCVKSAKGRVELNKKGVLVRRYYVNNGKTQGIDPVVGHSKYDEIIAKYKEGRTLQSLGTEYGVTRERIRQILKKYDITSTNSGRTNRNLLAIPIKQEALKKKIDKAESKCFALYGCTLEFKNALGLDVLNKFRFQKNSAVNCRGIEWGLTLKQWWDIWQESGQWENRGLGKGKYHMGRECDSGGYTFDNVKIISHSDNSKEARAMDKVLGRRGQFLGKASEG